MVVLVDSDIRMRIGERIDIEGGTIIEHRVRGPFPWYRRAEFGEKGDTSQDISCRYNTSGTIAVFINQGHHLVHTVMSFRALSERGKWFNVCKMTRHSCGWE